MRTTRIALHITAAFFALASAASAQPAHRGPAAAIALAKTLAPYDVVSIRINNSGDPSYTFHSGPDSFNATNIPLALIAGFAYDIKPDLIAGISGHVDSARFDIEAKAVPQNGSAPKLTDAQLDAMLIPLLADRFHLKAHLEPKTIPVYDLVAAKGGPKINLSPGSGHGSGGWHMDSHDASRILTGKNITMVYLAGVLSDTVGRKVIDKTGLSGHADITLKWSDDVAAEAGGPNVISIFTAVQEQLGLKLVPAKGPVDTLVIDHVEMPTAN